eukprot:4493224-Amphidinium_carterae.1
MRMKFGATRAPMVEPYTLSRALCSVLWWLWPYTCGLLACVRVGAATTLSGIENKSFGLLLVTWYGGSNIIASDCIPEPCCLFYLCVASVHESLKYMRHTYEMLRTEKCWT